MSRSSKIVICKEGREEHVLCNDFPHSGLWMYCCCCQTFIAWQRGRTDISIKQCPVCFASLNPRIYVCDHCSVTMMDFDNAGTRKLHNVAPVGSPQPACPGCLNSPKFITQKHSCEVMGADLNTALAECPYCNEQLIDAVDLNVTNNLPHRESITVLATENIQDVDRPVSHYKTGVVENVPNTDDAARRASASSSSITDNPLTDTNKLNNNWGSVTRITDIPGNDQYYNYDPFVEKRLQDYAQPEIISNRSVLQDSARKSQSPQIDVSSGDLSHVDMSFIADENFPLRTDFNGNVIDADDYIDYGQQDDTPHPQPNKLILVIYFTAAALLLIALIVLVYLMWLLF